MQCTLTVSRLVSDGVNLTEICLLTFSCYVFLQPADSVPFEMVRYFDQTHATITAQLASRFLIIFGVMINDTHKETLNYDV